LFFFRGTGYFFFSRASGTQFLDLLFSPVLPGTQFPRFVKFLQISYPLALLCGETGMMLTYSYFLGRAILNLGITPNAMTVLANLTSISATFLRDLR
jgi:hypothetical protein